MKKSKVPMGEINNIKISDTCNCMATRHPFLYSCIFCGLILCDRNKNNNINDIMYCPFCSNLVTIPMSAEDVTNLGFDESTIKAYKQKDKLLIFDRENSKRTHVHDSQSDYYDNSVWLSEEEKREIDEQNNKRKEALTNKYRNRKINISFDIAGRRIVEYEDNDTNEKTDDKEENYDNDNNNNNNNLISYDNTGLLYSKGKAGDIYRELKKSWDDNNIDNNISSKTNRSTQKFLKHSKSGNNDK